MKPIFFTCYGTNRGHSGTKHATRAEAQAFLYHSERADVSVRGYSDREVAAVDSLGRLWFDDQCAIPVLSANGARQVVIRQIELLQTAEV